MTVEGLAADEKLHPIQEAFLEHGAAQCGMCIPGFLVSTAELYDKRESMDRSEIREALAGNLCRCTGYQKIIDAATEVLSNKDSQKLGG